MERKIEGIIVSTVDYKESSKIINIFTKDEGIIGVLGKGCKNIKSKLRATSSPLTYGIFYLKQYDNRLPLLLEVDIKNNFKSIKTDIIKQNYSLFLLELTSKVYKHDENNNIYNLLITGLNKIEEDYDAGIITNIIELKLLEYLGIMPNIKSCVSCGSKFDIITISSYKGGLLCRKCSSNEYIYNLKTIKLIRMLYLVDISKISKIDISDDIKKEIDLFIDDYYDRYSGLYLKSKEFLKKFAKLIE